MSIKTKLNKLPNSDKLYIGIDQSLTATSICLMRDQEIEFRQVKVRTMGIPRLHAIYEAISDILKEFDGQIAGVAIEGYAFGAQGRVFNLGELGGVIRLLLFQNNINLVEVPPSYLKKFITGKGTSAKDIMIKEVYKKYELDTNDNNDCDAFCLAIVAQTYYEEELHYINTYKKDIHKNCIQVIGTHPNPLDEKSYIREMPKKMNLTTYEKIRRIKKIKT